MGAMEVNDHEINLSVAKLEYPEGFCQNLTSDFTGKTTTVIRGVAGRNSADYCNNWADIGPIIERELIHLYPQIKDWIAECYGESDVEAYADTPTKAAALCFLALKGINL